jgi:hypothetical protein
MILELLKEDYSVYRFNPEYKCSETIFDEAFVSVTKTADEISVVAASNSLEGYEAVESHWRIFKFQAVLEFELIGVINRISGALANGNISVFVISTYNTDYVMVKKEKIDDAIKILTENQYELVHSEV